MYKFILILLAIFFVGCSPKYVTKNHYIAPEEKGFGVCVNQCEQEKKICEQDCSNMYQGCLDNAYLRAKDISAVEMIKFDKAYENYLLQLGDYRIYQHKFDKSYIRISRDFNYFKEQCIKTKDKYACERRSELNNTLYNLKHNKIRKPREPRRPSFNRILNKQQSYCKSDCGCSSSFDRCYINCGGEVIPYKFCVENCD